MEHNTAEMIRCPDCRSLYLVSDLSFPEPEPDSNTQFDWLVANCPSCKADIQVPFDRVARMLRQVASKE